MVFEPVLVTRIFTEDVKCVVNVKNVGLFSCGRDGRLILNWEADGETIKENSCSKDIYQTNKVYVNSLIYTPVDCGYLVCGTAEGNIIALDNNYVPTTFTKIHNSNVCSLTVNPVLSDEIVSTSWDHTASVWSVKGRCHINTISFKSSPIWCAAYSSDGQWLLLGSADKSIDCCQRVQNKWTISFTQNNTHDDCIRAITFLSEKDLFASASNDGKIKLWMIDSEALVPLGVFKNHSSMIFTMAFESNSNRLISAGEDRSLIVWKVQNKSLDPVEIVRLPAETCWSTAWIDEETVLVGLSDGSVRLYCSDKTRFPNVDRKRVFKEFNEELAKLDILKDELDLVRQIELPDVTRLNSMSHVHSEIIFVVDNNKQKICKYESFNNEWRLIGSAPISAPSQKTSYNGKEYDYVFTISLENSSNILKLPYNLSDDPIDAARKFVIENRLGEHYVDEIVNFIDSNVKRPNKKADLIRSKYIPQLIFIRYSKNLNNEGVFKKIRLVNEKNEEKFTNDQINSLESFITSSDYNSAMPLIKEMIEKWSNDDLYPILDIIRYMLIDEDQKNRTLLKQDLNNIFNSNKERLSKLLTIYGFSHHSTLVLLKLLVNSIDNNEHLSLLIDLNQQSFYETMKHAKENTFLVGYSTIILNSAVRCFRAKCSDKLIYEMIKQMNCPQLSSTSSEIRFRLCIAIGTMKFFDNSFAVPDGLKEKLMEAIDDDPAKLVDLRRDLCSL